MPLIILGGRDHGSTVLPEAGRSKHVLHGYKAVDLRIGGRRLISILVERLRACGRFDPIYIAGPRKIYRDLVEDVELIDTDSDFGDNLRHSVGAVCREHPESRFAVTTCDILPDPAELESVLADFESRPRTDFWGVLVRAPENLAQLGESAWKPKYAIQPDGEDHPVAILPGHLMIVDPTVMRLDFVFRIFDIGYHTRNRSVAYRHGVAVRSVLFYLLWKDLKRLFSLRRPDFTWEILSTGAVLAKKLKGPGITQLELATCLGNLWVRSDHRRRHPERRGWITIGGYLSLAKDIDTEEEAKEIARKAASED